MFLSSSQYYMTYEPPYGALTQLWAGTMPEALNYNGEVSTLLFFLCYHLLISVFCRSVSDSLGKVGQVQRRGI